MFVAYLFMGFAWFVVVISTLAISNKDEIKSKNKRKQ
jgi:hypothetical protein